MTTPNAPNTPSPAPAPSGTATAQPPAGTSAPGGQPSTGEPQAPGGTQRQPVDPKVLETRVRRTVDLRTKEKAIAEQEKALSAYKDLPELAKKNPAQAMRRLLGVPDGQITPELTAALKALSQDVVGIQGEEKALEALPKSVREKLERLAELEKKAALVPELQKRLDELDNTRKAALSQLEERQRAERTKVVFDTGYKAVEEAAEQVPLVLAHPKAQDMLGEKWAALVKEAKEKGTLKGPEDAVPLVLEAAKKLQAELEENSNWLLQTDWARGKIGANGGARKGPPGAPPKSAPSTPGQRKPPRTGTPSMGEPAKVDWARLTPNQRKALLKQELSSRPK